MVKFSLKEQKTIDEKTTQLKQVCSGFCTYSDLANVITKRRVGWLKENLKEMLEKYRHLSPEEQA